MMRLEVGRHVTRVLYTVCKRNEEGLSKGSQEGGEERRWQELWKVELSRRS